MTVPDRTLAGRYDLLDLVGSGGMADVHRALDRVLQRDVAVKLLRTTASGTTERSRFADEARTLAALNHRGLVTVLDAGIDPGTDSGTDSEPDSGHPYLVMELIDGPTLGRHLRETGPLDPDAARALGAQVADALAYAHSRGVVHRDVKPGNILLRPDGQAVLTDFGIARMLGDADHHTQPGEVIGSPAYLSPEQVNGAPSGTAVDVYALGLVLLEVLTGERAYAGPPVEAAIARLTAPPAIPVSLDRDLRDLVVAMTALDPADRPTAAQVATRLSTSPDRASAPLAQLAVATGALDLGASTTTGTTTGGGATLVSAATLVGDPVRAPARRRKAGLLGLAAAVVTAVVVLGLAQLRPDAVEATPSAPTPSATPTSDPSPTARPAVATSPTPSATTAARTAAVRRTGPGTAAKPPARHAKPAKPAKHPKPPGKARDHRKK